MKKAFIFVLSVFLSLLIFFAFGEVIFRLTKRKPPQQGISLGKPHPVFHHIYESNYKGYEYYAGFPTQFSINSQGLRGPEFPVKKPSGTFRILVLGDSFVFGTAVNDDEIFTLILEKELNKLHSGTKYEVINCGVASYSPILEYLFLKEKALKYSPDLVLLFYDFSDLQDDFLYARRALYNRKGELIACNPFYINGFFDFMQLLRRHAHFYSYMEHKISSSLRRIRVLGLRGYITCHLKGKRTSQAITDTFSTESARYDRYFMLREGQNKDVIMFYWNKSAFWLDKIRALLNENKIGFILVAYPYSLQVSPVAWSKGRVFWHFQPDKLYDSQLPFEMFYDYAKKRKAAFINLLSYIKQHSREELYYDFDGHWTALGHKRVAEGILAASEFRKALFADIE